MGSFLFFVGSPQGTVGSIYYYVARLITPLPALIVFLAFTASSVAAPGYYYFLCGSVAFLWAGYAYNIANCLEMFRYQQMMCFIKNLPEDCAQALKTMSQAFLKPPGGPF